MRGFRTRSSVEEVVALIAERTCALDPETVALADAARRVLAKDVVAPWPMPPFDRAAMDGFAVPGEETFGANAYQPAVFRLIGHARPGRPFEGALKAGEAVEITTGAPLPAGADAVARAEAARCEADVVSIIEPTPPGRHVGHRGEDCGEGSLVLEHARLLRPQDLGLLSAMGLAEVPVVRLPRVAVISTGDELLPAGSSPAEARIPDMNGPMLAALVARDGGLPRAIGPLPDDRGLLRTTIIETARQLDAILVSGGSSTGPEDHLPSLVAELGELAVHGVALRPASPSGLGFVGGKPVVLLPGNPVSCLCAYDFFAGRIIRRLGGRPAAWPYRSLELRLAQKLVSAIGRVDYARVRIVAGQVEPIAISGASILSSTTRADGFVVVPADLEGYPAGAVVTVWLYDLTG